MSKSLLLACLVAVIALTTCGSREVRAQPIEQRFFLMQLDAPELAPYERLAVHRACKPDVPRFVRQETFMMHGLQQVTLASSIRCVPRQGIHIIVIECQHVSHRSCTIGVMNELSLHLELMMRLPQLMERETSP